MKADKKKTSAKLLNNGKLYSDVKKQDNILKLIIVIFGFVLYANTLGHNYALDDTVTIWKNEFTQKGIAGIKDILSYDSMAGMFGKDMREIEGGRYRPLSLVMFAFELELFGQKVTAPDFKGEIVAAPFVGHLFNVLYYCLALLLLYCVLKKLFKEYQPKYWYLSIPFIATLIFAAHPLHTEVVANIKSRDEIMAFIFSLLALNQSINYVDEQNKKWWRLLLVFVFVFLGSLSKEITITFVAIIPFAIYFFRTPKIADYIKLTAAAFTGALLYMIIRSFVIADQTDIEAALLLNNPFLGMSSSEKYATILYTLLLYLKLLFVPHPLTWDYYPYHIQVMNWSDWQVVLSLAIHLALLVTVIFTFKKKSVYAFAILVYAATLSITSNLVFNIGVFMSERFMFVSLLGGCLAFAYFFSETLPKLVSKDTRIAYIAVASLLLLAFSAKTITRNPVWKDSSTLFAHDVMVSQNSIKGNSSYASDLYTISEGAEAAGDIQRRDSLMRKSIPYFERALEFDESNSESLVRLGNIYYKLNNDYKTMFEYYIKALKKSPLNRDVWNNTVGVLTYNLDDPEYEKKIWKKYSELSPEYYESFFQLGELYYTSKPQMNDSAVFYFEKAYNLNNSDFKTLFHLGMSYGNLNNFVKAQDFLQKANSIKADAEVLKFLGIISGMNGDGNQAYQYFLKSSQLNPKDADVQRYLQMSK